MVAGSSLVEAVRFVGWRMTERGSNHAVATLLEVLDALPDPRSVHGRRHPLGAILGLAVCAMLCGARSLYAISQWGRDQGLEASQTLGFTRNPTPCVSTLQQVFSRCSAGVQPVGPGCFQIRLAQWLKYQGLEEGEALAIDGKRLRGIHGEQLPGMHLVAAYAHQPGILVGQQAVRAKRNELDAVPGLLEQLELRGRVVTAAAQFTQRRVCQHIVSQGALFLCHKGQSACLEAGHRRYLVRYPGG